MIAGNAEVVQARGVALEGVPCACGGPGTRAVGATLGDIRRRLWLCHQCWTVTNAVRVAEDARL